MAEETETLTVETGEDTTPAATETTVTPEQALDNLKAQLASEKQRADREEAARKEAERQTAAARDAVTTVRAEKEDTELAMVKNAIEQTKTNMGVLRANYAAAAAAGDWDAAAEAQQGMAEGAAALQTLTTGQQHLEAVLEERKKAPPPVADPVEALAQQLSPRSAAWVRAHPEYARDPRLNQRMLAAHNLAVTDGLEADTDDYFTAVETTLGLKIPGETPPKKDEAVMSEAATVARKETPPPSAPAQRGNGTTTMRLTAEEREIAEMNGQTPEEYAAAKLALQKEGRLTH